MQQISYLANNGETNKQTVELRIPAANDLSDSKLFNSSVNEAFEFVRERQPGGIKATIEFEQRRLEALDPRFGVKILASDDKTHCQISAKEEVLLTLTINAAENQGRLHDLIERGMPVEFASNEASVKGSPLFESFAKGPLLIEPHPRKGELTISAIEGEEDRLLITMPAVLRFGRSEGLLTAELVNGPLKIETDFHNKTHEPLKSRITAPLKNWFGQSLVHLTSFASFRQFILAIDAGVGFKVEFSIPGEFSLPLRTSASQLSEMRKYLFAVDGLHKARWIAQRLSIDATLKEADFQHEWNDIFELYEILKSDGVERPAPNQHLSFTIPKDDATQFLASPSLETDGGHFKRVSSWEFWFFGKTVLIPELSHECTNMLIDFDSATSQLGSTAGERIRLDFHGSDTSTQTIRIDRRQITVQSR